MPPNRSAAARYIDCTDASSATSTCTASPSTPDATFSAASPSTSATQTRAPSRAKTSAASAPMPPPAPVITQTFPASRSAISSLRRVVDVLDLAVALERVHAELAPEPALLDTAERRRRPHRRVRVDREDAALDGARDAQRAGAVPRPDRARESVVRVVRDPDRFRFVGERDQRG